MVPSSPSQVLNASKTDAFLVSNLTNIRYLTGVELSAGAVLVTSRRIVLFVDGRYSEVAKKNARKGVQVQDRSALKKALARVLQCGCEADEVTLAQFRQWKRKYKNTKFVQRSGIIEEFRRVKSPQELTKFRKAQRITHTLLKKVPGLLKLGVTEKKVARSLLAIAEDLGADALSFEPIVAFGTHSSRPHHRASHSKLKKGQMVQIDIGARYHGYCADQSAVFFTGPKTKKQEHALKAVEEAKAEAVALVKEGVSTHDLDEAARGVLKSYGYEKEFCHSLGHGLGLDIHEGAHISVKAPEEFLQKGEIVTIEPGVYFAGQFGVRLEEEVVVE
tara:strand:- start:397 stop:1392 length:996 start_codon:yes stop_codon:yes gene_type:complete